MFTFFRGKTKEEVFESSDILSVELETFPLVVEMFC